MASNLDILQQGGILRPEITVQAAAAAGLELAAASVMLMRESGGGRMIYGHDPGPTAGIYTKGGPVTKENFLAYRKALADGRIRRQGVGDCQLTSAEFQDRGDNLGGCWDPYCNQLSGFIGLANRINQFGLRDGFRRYNGSGRRAEEYADACMRDLKTWRARLAAATVSWVPGDSLAPILKQGDGRKGDNDRGHLHWWVVSAQALINIRGLPNQVAVDGVFGPDTTAMIKELQNRSNVPADGIINAATWRWLLGNDAPDFA